MSDYFGEFRVFENILLNLYSHFLFVLLLRILDNIYTMHICHGMGIGIAFFVLSFCAEKCT